MKFLIEHLEPRLYAWCRLEYRHISEIVGKNNLIFTNLKTNYQKNKLKQLGEVNKKSVLDLRLKKACLLDPAAEKTLNPREAGKFSFFVFGGILGDFPPGRRTKKTLGRLKAEKRNLGSQQMSTDTAVYVVKEMLKGRKLEEFTFIDRWVIQIKEGEELTLPFRYVLLKSKPLLPKGFLEFVKKKGF